MRNKIKHKIVDARNIDLQLCNNVSFLSGPLSRYFVVAHDFKFATYFGKLICKTEHEVHDFIFYMTGRREGKVWWQNEFEIVKSVTPEMLDELEQKIVNMSYGLFRRDVAHKMGWTADEMHEHVLNKKLKNRHLMLGKRRNLNFLVDMKKGQEKGFVECLENRQIYDFRIEKFRDRHRVRWANNWVFQHDVFVKGLKHEFDRHILRRYFFNYEVKSSDDQIRKNTLGRFVEKHLYLDKNLKLQRRDYR